MPKNLIYAIVALVIIAGGWYFLQTREAVPSTSDQESIGEGDLVTLGDFQGFLPCADCEGIDTRLTLMRYNEGSAEGMYTLSEARIKNAEPVVPTEVRGTWTTLRGTDKDPNAVVYQLNPDGPIAPRYFQKVSDITIRPLDAQGHVIVSSDIPSDLTMRDAQ